ncbi:MAG: DUF1983 domain-containing protein [Gammaproteobacteria bacterium]|nr:MAG: DUF1983 domain-containing protein [Gammaproteobacteria bacterium]
MSDLADRFKGIPGIPDGVLNAIADENVRTVLRAIADGWNVRNGVSGNGDNAFITKKDVENLRIGSGGSAQTLKSLLQTVSNDQSGNSGGGTSIKPGDIDGILSDLQTQIINSAVFRDLGERVDYIDKPGGIFDQIGQIEVVANNDRQSRIDGDTALQTNIDNLGVRVDNSETAIQSETTQRVNADNAITEHVNTQYASVNENIGLIQTQQTTTANNVAALSTKTDTMQSTINGHTASIAAESTARADADGKLFSQYTLKLDVNGLISGFGLSSSDSSSDFLIRADRFSIVSPTYNKNSPNAQKIRIPFIVLTTPQVINGRTVQPGVYIESAAIKDGTIDTAKIGVAAVDTLTIKGNAVTVPVGGSGYGYAPAAYLYMGQPGKILVLAMANWISPPGEAAASGYLKTLCDGIYGPEVGISMADQFSGSAVAIGGYDVGAGTHSISFQYSISGGARNLGATGLFAIGLQR